jgi:hypothetical protein
MDLAKVLQQLHEELENLNAAISSLERLQEAGKHRTKATEWLGDIASVPVVRKRKSKERAQNQPDKPSEEEGGGKGFS